MIAFLVAVAVAIVIGIVAGMRALRGWCVPDLCEDCDEVAVFVIKNGYGKGTKFCRRHVGI